MNAGLEIRNSKYEILNPLQTRNINNEAVFRYYDLFGIQCLGLSIRRPVIDEIVIKVEEA